MAKYTFSQSLQRFAQGAGENADLVLRKVGIEISTRIILRTPVLTGRARANWQTSVGSPRSNVLESVDKSGTGSIAKAQSQLGNFTCGPSIWITNNLPYIEELERGSSARSPEGMVRITLREFLSIVNKEAAAVKVRKFNPGRGSA